MKRRCGVHEEILHDRSTSRTKPLYSIRGLKTNHSRTQRTTWMDSKPFLEGFRALRQRVQGIFWAVSSSVTAPKFRKQQVTPARTQQHHQTVYYRLQMHTPINLSTLRKQNLRRTKALGTTSTSKSLLLAPLLGPSNRTTNCTQADLSELGRFRRLASACV